ncbi:hypothetical protein ACP275_05G025200 [Erythranthe tilingii]
MRGMTLGKSRGRPRSTEKTLRRCRNNEEADHVILIDGDSENFDNVIFIDVPESLPKKSQGSSILNKDKRCSIRNVIYIDDDDDEDEATDSNHSDGVNNVDFAAGTSSNRESCKNSADSRFAQDNATPVRLSKCKRTYSGKAVTRNCYGLDADSESDSSDNDLPDCVLVEDSTELQQMWEKAFTRRRKNIPSGHSDVKDRDSTAHIIDDHHQNIETNDASSPFRSADDYDFDRPNCEPGISSSHVEQTAENQASWNSAFKEQSTKETSEVEPGQPNLKSCGKSTPSQQGEDNDSQNEDTLPFVETCIFNEREKLKETDEYKRAIEEEWASRQQALQIQAEEAQHQKRMRKRLKAESMRLLDMERRQKERVEEMRSIQKKDEENMNMKEIIRTEVRTELSILENTCYSMAFLLHSLGINVGGWPNPLPQEVQTAYKRALLTFHPDRASKSDIRQQVEAEEKFKLINRLKEKFSPL